MAGAIGISLALNDRPVVALVGDGSAMYSIQSLWTAAHMKRPITYVIPNNRGYRILKQRLKSFRGAENFVGMELEDPTIDFVKIAQSMGVSATKVSKREDLRVAITEGIKSGRTNLIEVEVSPSIEE